MKTFYLLSMTDTMQQYNMHSLFETLDEAKEMLKGSRDNVHRGGDIVDVIENNDMEYYWEHTEGFSRLYITEVKLGLMTL